MIKISSTIVILIISCNIFKAGLIVAMNSMSNCQNPSTQYLDHKLAKAYLNLIKLEREFLATQDSQSVYPSAYEEFYQMDQLTDYDNHESIVCHKTKMTRIHIRERSVCDFRYVSKYRQHKYPFYVLDVVCSCEKCAQEKSCAPIGTKQPLLIRGECINGTYEFNHSYEIIAQSCSCLGIKINHET